MKAMRAGEARTLRPDSTPGRIEWIDGQADALTAQQATRPRAAGQACDRER